MIILGAGPIGIEAATLAAARGWDVRVFERGKVGEHVRMWGHVTLFSPWSLNRSAWGEATLRAMGRPLHDDAGFPTGYEYASDYLDALASAPALAGRIFEDTEVLGVSRAHALKGDWIGSARRKDGAFVTLVRDAAGERYEEADVVLDTTGVYAQPGHLGVGGLPAPGEADCEAYIERHIPNALGVDRADYANRHALVIGAGYSAVTTLRLLMTLREQAQNTRVTWLVRDEDDPYELIEGDALPQRATLSALGNAAARGEVDGISARLGGFVASVEDAGEGVRVRIRRGEGEEIIEADRIVANVGYRPDTELLRELQVHLCYASEGPMKLAASLLAAGGGGGDCLTQTSAGVDTLLNPEPDLFILGAKSYGRGSAFLLKLGFEQIEQVMAHLGDPSA